MGLRQPHADNDRRRGPAEGNSARCGSDDRVRAGIGTRRCRVVAMPPVSPPFLTIASGQPLRITPTDVSSFVRREQCERFLRSGLAEPGAAPDPGRHVGFWQFARSSRRPRQVSLIVWRPLTPHAVTVLRS